MKKSKPKTAFMTTSEMKAAHTEVRLWRRVEETIQKSKELRSLNNKTIDSSVNCRFESVKTREEIKKIRFDNEQCKLTFPELHMTKQEAEKTAQQMLLHDIRSPMAKISGLMQLLKDQTLAEELKHILSLVEEQSNRALELTQLYSVYQQLETGTYQSDNKHFDILMLLQKIKCTLKEKQHPIPIEIYVKGKIQKDLQTCMIHSDPVIIELMLQNLIQNAVDASPSHGKVKIDIQESQTLHKALSSDVSSRSFTIISICNQGMIPEEIQKRFFEKFVTYGKYKGTGLGTYISMLVAKACQGTLSFKTSELDGTCLQVGLPCSISDSLFDTSF